MKVTSSDLDREVLTSVVTTWLRYSERLHVSSSSWASRPSY